MLPLRRHQGDPKEGHRLANSPHTSAGAHRNVPITGLRVLPSRGSPVPAGCGPGSGAPLRSPEPWAGLGGLCLGRRWRGDVPACSPAMRPRVAAVTPLPPTQGKATVMGRDIAPGVRPRWASPRYKSHWSRVWPAARRRGTRRGWWCPWQGAAGDVKGI